MAKKRVLVRRARQHGHEPCARLYAHPRVRGRRRLHAPHRRQEAARCARQGAKRFSNYDTGAGRAEARHRLVNTLPDTHADFAIKAMEAGAHVFVEKPLAETVESAQEVVDTAKRTGKKLVIGYILRAAPVLDQVHRDRPPARHAARLPHEPEPAVERRDLGLAQAADGFLSADRRLRRPLCRRDVPDDQGEADTRAGHGRASHATR